MCIPLLWVGSSSSHRAQTLGCGYSALHCKSSLVKGHRRIIIIFLDSGAYTSDVLTQCDSSVSTYFICKPHFNHEVTVVKRVWQEVSVLHIHSEKLQSKAFAACHGAAGGSAFSFSFFKRKISLSLNSEITAADWFSWSRFPKMVF